MSVFLATESGAYINCGRNSSVDTMGVGTMAGWVRVLSWSPEGNYFALINKGNPNYSSYNAIDFMPFAPDNGKLDCLINRATTDWNLRSADLIVRLNEWAFVAKTWNLSLTASEQHLYYGRQNSAVREPAYAIRDLGSGTQVSESTMPVGIGNFGSPNALEYYDGGSNREIQWVGMWPRQLSRGELDVVRRETMQKLIRPRGAVLYTYLGNSSGIQPDLSGNGLHGTMGTTNSSAPRIGRTFPNYSSDLSSILAGATAGGSPPPSETDGMFFSAV